MWKLATHVLVATFHTRSDPSGSASLSGGCHVSRKVPRGDHAIFCTRALVAPRSPTAAPLATSGLNRKNGGDLAANADADAKLAALLNNAPGAEAWLARSRVVRHALSNVQFGEGFVTLYRHPTVFGFVDPSSAPQHLALRNALTKNTHSLRRRLSGLTACDQAEEDFMDRAVSDAEFVCCLRFVDCCGTSSARLRGSYASSVAALSLIHI